MLGTSEPKNIDSQMVVSSMAIYLFFDLLGTIRKENHQKTKQIQDFCRLHLFSDAWGLLARFEALNNSRGFDLQGICLQHTLGCPHPPSQHKASSTCFVGDCLFPSTTDYYWEGRQPKTYNTCMSIAPIPLPSIFL